MNTLLISALITSLMKNSPDLNVWIGLSDRGSFGKFHWTDESNLDYTNWAAGQPDGIATRPVSIGGLCGEGIEGTE